MRTLAGASRSRAPSSAHTVSASPQPKATTSLRIETTSAVRSAGRLQGGKRAGAGAELATADAEALEHADVEVGQRRRVLRAEGEVPAVLEPAAGQHDRQVPGGVGAGVAEVAAEEHRGPVEQALAFLARLLQLRQEVAQGLHLL